MVAHRRRRDDQGSRGVRRLGQDAQLDSQGHRGGLQHARQLAPADDADHRENPRARGVAGSSRQPIGRFDHVSPRGPMPGRDRLARYSDPCDPAAAESCRPDPSSVVDVFWRELAKFGVVGAIAFLIDFGGFHVLFYGPLQGHLDDGQDPLRRGGHDVRLGGQPDVDLPAPAQPPDAPRGDDVLRRQRHRPGHRHALAELHPRHPGHGLPHRGERQHRRWASRWRPSSGSGPTASSSSPGSTRETPRSWSSAPEQAEHAQLQDREPADTVTEPRTAR